MSKIGEKYSARLGRGVLRRLPLQDLFQFPPNVLVVGTVGVLELGERVEDVPHLGDRLRCRSPEVLVRFGETLGFNVPDLVNLVVLTVSPGQLLVEEVEDDEVEAPEVVPSRQVLSQGLAIKVRSCCVR